MAIRIDASADKISRTTNLPTITTFTLMGWFYISVDRNTWSSFLHLGPSSGSSQCYVMQTTNDGTTLNLFSGGTDHTGSALTVGTWFHAAMSVSGTGAGLFLGYLNGVLDITDDGNASATSQVMTIGGDYASGEWLNGRCAAIKAWSAVLTADEIKQEMRCYTPVRTANLNTWSPMLAVTDVQNYALAGGGAWTVAGTPTTEDGPPIAWSLRPSMPRPQTPVALLQPALGTFALTGVGL